jgi:pimeloyl-ACP methyl ester carboxylesterase
MPEVHHRIMSHLHLSKDHIIVAHSLGTVIAYHLLHQFTHFRAHRFITLDSPLAFKVIQEKLTLPISRPQQLHSDWFNFYSPDDFLTAFSLSEAPFNFESPIINQAITTLVDKPHQITGYLAHPTVIKSIVDALKLRK